MKVTKGGTATAVTVDFDRTSGRSPEIRASGRFKSLAVTIVGDTTRIRAVPSDFDLDVNGQVVTVTPEDDDQEVLTFELRKSGNDITITSVVVTEFDVESVNIDAHLGSSFSSVDLTKSTANRYGVKFFDVIPKKLRQLSVSSKVLNKAKIEEIWKFFNDNDVSQLYGVDFTGDDIAGEWDGNYYLTKIPVIRPSTQTFYDVTLDFHEVISGESP